MKGVDIYLAPSTFGKYPPLFNFTLVNNLNYYAYKQSLKKSKFFRNSVHSLCLPEA